MTDWPLHSKTAPAVSLLTVSQKSEGEKPRKTSYDLLPNKQKHHLQNSPGCKSQGLFIRRACSKKCRDLAVVNGPRCNKAPAMGLMWRGLQVRGPGCQTHSSSRVIRTMRKTVMTRITRTARTRTIISIAIEQLSQANNLQNSSAG